MNSKLLIESAGEELEKPFAHVLNSAKELMTQLGSTKEVDFSIALKSAPEKPGVYVLLEDGKSIYVGRARKIKSRLRGHVSKTAQGSTFAFLLARKITGKEATYKSKGSREDLLKNDATFKVQFLKCVEQIKSMKVKYIEIEDDNLQYFFEFYCAVELQALHNKFRTT